MVKVANGKSNKGSNRKDVIKIAIEKLRSDINFCTGTTFHNGNNSMEDAKKKLEECENALEKLRDKHGK